MVFIFTQPDFHCLHPHRGNGQNLNAWSLLQQSPVTWTLTLVMFGHWKMSKRTKGAQLYNCNCPKIWYHENWNNHVPAISQLCPYHKSQLVHLCSQSASLPVCLCKASELNLRIIKDQEYSRRRQQQDRVQSRGSRSLPQVAGWKRGGSLIKSFHSKNIESQKGRQNIPFLLFSWRRSGSSWSQTK